MGDNTEAYDVVVVGGGPAGQSAALYATRLGHEAALIGVGGGRAAMMQEVHNLIGVPEETAGVEFIGIGAEQLDEYGTVQVRDRIENVSGSAATGFTLTGASGVYTADVVVLATGFADARPDPPLPRTGRGLHYCLHCDAYMFTDEPVYVMGHGESAAHVAAIMLNFTDSVDLLTRGAEPTWSAETARILDGHPIDVIRPDIAEIHNGDDGWLEAITFEDGQRRPYRGGFAMYGAEYHNELAAALGCTIDDDGAVPVDDHGRTDVDGVYAVGDLTPGHNQVPIALAEGARAGIDIHFQLRSFPTDPAFADGLGDVRGSDVIPAAAREAAIDHHIYGPAAED